MGDAGVTGQVGGLAVEPRDGVGYSGVMGGTRVPSSLRGQPSELAVGGQVGGFAVGLRGGVGYGSVLGGAGALGAPHGQSGGLAIGLGRGFGHGGATNAAGAIGTPSAALGRVTYDGPDAAGVGRVVLGDGGAGDPSTTFGKQTNNIVTTRAVTSWSNPTTRLPQMICKGRPASMQRVGVQGYVGDTVDISTRVHTMLESLDGIDLLAFVPRGGASVSLRLLQHL